MDTLTKTERSAPEADVQTSMRNSGFRAWADAVLGIEPRRRIRTTQWLITVMVYVACGLVMWFGVRQGWLYASLVSAWCAFVLVGLMGFYVALRSGWSERLVDPALTTSQMMLGIVAVDWGYLIAGPVRSMALYPLMLIFTFGAFSLGWRRMTWLTAFAMASLFGCLAALTAEQSRIADWSVAQSDLRLDMLNAAVVAVLLPALSLISARLSSLRSKLHSQREALTAALAEVQRLATHDELTGLANRRHMQERLAQEQSRCQRLELFFSIAIIDLDHFKWVNDAHGHAGGDDVLRAFAAEASSTLRACDLIARWGGEEFLILLPNTRGPQALASAIRLLERVRELPHGVGPPLSFSAGVTEYRRDEPVTETVVRADRKMYEAKRAGRNTVMLE